MRYLFFVLTLFILTNCSTFKNRNKLNEAKIYEALKTLETRLVNQDLTLNKEVADSLYRRSLFFDSIHPKSKHKEEVLTLAAKSADGLDRNQENIQIIDSLLHYFPKSKNAPIYLYNKGKIYEEKMGDTTKAIEVYTIIINRFPEHELAKNLIHYLRFLNQSHQEQLDSLH